MFKSYEEQYMDILNNVMTNGSENINKRTGVGTKRIPNAVINVDLQKEFPILKSKQVFWKTALKEILWIMKDQSNNINDLDAHIWDEWADEEGSIGKAYGFQIAKNVTIDGKTYDSQVHYILETLKEDPSSRRAVIDLWNVDDLGDMNLTPCCYSSVWNIIDGKLNCLLVQRSADYLVGVPFNTTQYALLTFMFARHLGVEVGILTHVMADCHIYTYESHINGAKRMIDNYFELCLENEISQTPKLIFTSDNTNFFNTNVNDVKLDNYHPVEKINFDVAV